MKIIKLKSSDNIDKIVDIFDQYMMFYKLPSSIDKYKKFLSDRLINNEAIIFMAVNEQEDAIGFALNYPPYSSLSLGKILVLNDLFVLHNERKKGVAQALINAVFEFAKKKTL
ncbi:N-acetyltransferase family protein [Flavobacterium sp. P21]|uniref:GNAT family N-acetyltransferase n=1 Tax=Flavobacterium sp. P21 TaxID=3423948 RepID=UPI003D669D05